MTKNTEHNAALTRSAEKKLIRAAQRGDHQAGRALIDYHKQRLFAFVWRVIPNHQDAEDICQEAFLRAFAALASFDSTYRFCTWLFTIAYRLCLNSIRRNQTIHKKDWDWTSYASDQSDTTVLQLAQSEEAQRLKNLIWGSVEKLTPMQRAAIILFYRESMSCQEIAQVMETPIATVKSHLHRARTKLKEWIEPVLGPSMNHVDVLVQAG